MYKRWCPTGSLGGFELTQPGSEWYRWEWVMGRLCVVMGGSRWGPTGWGSCRVLVGLCELGSNLNRVKSAQIGSRMDLSRNQLAIGRTWVSGVGWPWVDSNRFWVTLGRLKLAFKRDWSAQASVGWTWVGSSWHRMDIDRLKLAFIRTWVSSSRHHMELGRLKPSFGWTWPLSSAQANF